LVRVVDIVKVPLFHKIATERASEFGGFFVEKYLFKNFASFLNSNLSWLKHKII